MVTMLLTSIFRNASSAVHEVEPHPQGKRVAFIPTASAVEPWGPVHSALSKRALQRLGFEVEQLDVEDVPSGSAERVTRSIGESAGSVITAPDIGYIKLMDRTDKAPDLTDYAGLGLADFRVVPHHHAAAMGHAAQRILDRYGADLSLKPLTNRQALLVKDGKTRLLR